ncbi:hypothetical protein ELQ35_18870 [Peribacillus cavernae]|uniref:Membrane protein NfeD2 N-terminal transmembrane domain-containing protein n=1 Tax=Peribacillus cavernae TaxID=1674310 RepID=A0A3S0W391_9BACI|nr:hypothetical protein [Peribacillus cavernae]RUQ26003.1 hypothetical protein ELQ35_18870 [Peribacillus cavernae]
MELFGAPLEQIYLYGLIIAGVLTFVFILLNDIFAGLHLPDVLNPALILSFLTIFSACGYLLEHLTSLSSIFVSVIAAVTAVLLVSLLNVLILIPLSSAEESLVILEADLKGRVGTVITSVPVDGFGEVLIESKSGSFAKPAVSFHAENIPSQTKVLIIDVQNGILHVAPREQILDIG